MKIVVYKTVWVDNVRTPLIFEHFSFNNEQSMTKKNIKIPLFQFKTDDKYE